MTIFMESIIHVNRVLDQFLGERSSLMAEMAVILVGWLSQMMETYIVCNLQLHHSNLEFTIHWHIHWRKPCQLPGWMKISSYYSAAVGIRTSDLPHTAWP